MIFTISGPTDMFKTNFCPLEPHVWSEFPYPRLAMSNEAVSNEAKIGFKHVGRARNCQNHGFPMFGKWTSPVKRNCEIDLNLCTDILE